MLAHTIKRFGIEARMFEGENPSEMEALIDDKTRAIFFESLSSPQMVIIQMEEIVQIAKKHKTLIIGDNIVVTACLFKPFDFGIDVAVYDTSEYVSGQGTGIGGAIV